MYRFSSILACISITMLIASGCAAPTSYVGRAAPRAQEKKSNTKAFTLDNGFTVLVRSGETSGTTAVQVWIADGSAYEPEGKKGVAHLVEHLLFEAGGGKPGSAESAIEDIGGVITGNTGKDYTYVGVTLPGPGWEKAVELLYRMTADTSFTKERVKDQQDVIALEIKDAETDPERVLMDNLMDTAYTKHPYKGPVTGSVASVKALTPADAEDYHKAVYVPLRMTLVVAGDASPAQVKAEAEKTFGAMPVAKPGKPRPMDEPPQISGRERVVSMPVKLTYMAMGWHVCPTSDKDIYPLEVLRAVMGEGSGSRLAMELISRKPLAIAVGAELYAYSDRGLFVVNATLADPDDISKTKEELLGQAYKLKTDLITGDELKRAVMSIERQQLESTETADGQAYALGYWATVYGGKTPGEYMDSIRAVTAEDVRRAAQTYLGEGNYTLSIIKPEKANRQED
jgi:zinc protease